MSEELRCRALTVAPGATAILRGVDLTVPAGTRAVLVGPSGAGKTTLLRAIAGLQEIAEGDIHVGGRSMRGVPPQRRRIAYVFQEPRLLGHLDVLDNVALPLRAQGAGRSERRVAARVRLDEVGLAGLAGRRVQGLSGGEQQRVALARALCARPRLLLLDEPLASLDPGRRAELRRLIARVQAEHEITTLMVSHDRAEAAELAQHLALMIEGRIVQQGDPRCLFERPASAVVARFFGATNIVQGRVRDGWMALGGGAIAVDGPDGPATVAIRPEHVCVGAAAGVRATVAEALYRGTDVHLGLDLGNGQRLEASCPVARAPTAGARVTIAVAADHVWRMPGEAAAPAGRSPAHVRDGSHST